MSLVNLTPHPIIILDENNNVVRTIPSTGLVRLKSKTVSDNMVVDCIPITRTVFGEATGLPDIQIRQFEDEFTGSVLDEITTFFIVSQLVKSALPLRRDLLVPAEVQRDEKGNIIGCRSLGI